MESIDQISNSVSGTNLWSSLQLMQVASSGGRKKYLECYNFEISLNLCQDVWKKDNWGYGVNSLLIKTTLYTLNNICFKVKFVL